MKSWQADIIDEAMKRQGGITQKALAELLSVRPEHISALRTGSRPISNKLAVKLGAMISVPPAKLIERRMLEG